MIQIRNVSLLIGLFVTLSLFLLQSALAADNKDEAVPRSYAEGLADRLFEAGALSFYFDSEVQSIADHFTRGTRFSGKVQVNRPRAPDYLNIYVFHYIRALPVFLKNNCNAFSRDSIIICDHALLDSIPSTHPIVINQGDGVALPLAMQWIIGHEIGHVLFQDDLSSFGQLGEGEAAMGSTATSLAIHASPNSAIRNPTMVSNPAEVRADRFAIRGLPIQSLSTWIQLGSQLADAIYWEVDYGKHLGSSQASVPGGQTSDGDANLIYVDVVEGGHPPMLLRLTNLRNEIFATYPDYPKGAPALNPDVHTKARYVTPTTPQDPATRLFYGGFYLGSDFDAKHGARFALERALAIRSRGNTAYANLLLKRACGTTSNEPEPWKTLWRLSCYQVNKKQEPGDPSVIRECDRFSVKKAGRCYGALLLVGNRCVGKEDVLPEFAKLCMDRAVLRSQYDSYLSAGLKYSADDRLADWILAEEYRFQKNVVGLSGSDLDGWVDRAIGSTVSSGRIRNAQELNDLYIADSSIPESEDDHKRRISLLIRKRHLRERAGNMDDAIAIAEEVITQLDVQFPDQRMLRAFERFDLGKLLREYRLVIYGDNDAQEFVMLNREVEAEERVGIKAKHDKAPQVFLEAAELLRSPEGETEAKPDQYNREVGYLNALSGALFSYNVLGLERVSDALALARTLRHELGALKNGPRIKALGYDFDLLCAAPALENISVAELASKDGDPAVALRSAQSSRSIRKNSSEATSPEILRTLAYAYFASGNMRKAKAVGLDFIQRWENTHHLRFSLDSTMLVRGKPVTLGTVVESTDEEHATDK